MSEKFQEPDDKEGIVHHYHHKEEPDGYRRELQINGSVYSICLASNFPDENMEYLTKTAMKILQKLRDEGK
jgi:hypothetical protein